MPVKTRTVIGLFLLQSMLATSCGAEDFVDLLPRAMENAGQNSDELFQALKTVKSTDLRGMEFLIAHMPERDLRTLSSQFLKENVEYAYRAWREAAWHEQVSEDMFFNNILPFASVNEQRDNWRKNFYERFQPLVAEAKSPAQAAAILNNKIFPLLKVKYSTKRRSADQGPFETMESGLASCTGLSILLIDACRAVGVPARFAGTPLWSNRSGNHSWVEIWDGAWHFTGAAEPTGDQLDRGWFKTRAAQAKAEDPLHAIYAVSYRQTPLQFRCVWDESVDYVSAVNVTDRYTRNFQELPEGAARAMFRVLETSSHDRCACDIRVKSTDGRVVFRGTTKDERFDANDHTIAIMQLGKKYLLEVDAPSGRRTTTIELSKPDELFTVELPN